MLRRTTAVLLAAFVVSGCAGSAKLARQSEVKLAGGENGRAWQLATRALDKDPGNTRARATAATAGNLMARQWEYRIHTLAQSDSVASAEQVLALAAFRVEAVRYAAITVTPEWALEEQALRGAAARTCYQRGVTEMGAKRPKRAWRDFTDAQRFVADYRNAAALADRAWQKALTRVAFVPFATDRGRAALGRDVAAEWRDRMAERLRPPEAHFTNVLGSAEVEQRMSVAQLGNLDRADAIEVGRRAGATRIVWGAIGGIDAHTTTHLFTDVVARRVVEKRGDGESVTRWVDVPIAVVSRVRTVTADVDYEVIATASGTTLAHRRAQRSSRARVVWTSYVPEGDLDAYALVSDAVRAADPGRAKDVEARWKETCGEGTTLREVLGERRATRGQGRYDREVLPRFIAGATFAFLQELPPVDDLAVAALANGWEPLRADLLRLDEADDVDLGMAVETRR